MRIVDSQRVPGVLLTRGMRGVWVYTVDPETQHYLRTMTMCVPFTSWVAAVTGHCGVSTAGCLGLVEVAVAAASPARLTCELRLEIGRTRGSRGRGRRPTRAIATPNSPNGASRLCVTLRTTGASRCRSATTLSIEGEPEPRRPRAGLRYGEGRHARRRTRCEQVRRGAILGQTSTKLKAGPHSLTCHAGPSSLDHQAPLMQRER